MLSADLRRSLSLTLARLRRRRRSAFPRSPSAASSRSRRSAPRTHHHIWTCESSSPTLCTSKKSGPSEAPLSERLARRSRETYALLCCRPLRRFSGTARRAETQSWYRAVVVEMTARVQVAPSMATSLWMHRDGRWSTWTAHHLAHRQSLFPGGLMTL